MIKIKNKKLSIESIMLILLFISLIYTISEYRTFIEGETDFISDIKFIKSAGSGGFKIKKNSSFNATYIQESEDKISILLRFKKELADENKSHILHLIHNGNLNFTDDFSIGVKEIFVEKMNDGRTKRRYEIDFTDYKKPVLHQEFKGNFFKENSFQVEASLKLWSGIDRVFDTMEVWITGLDKIVPSTIYPKPINMFPSEDFPVVSQFAYVKKTDIENYGIHIRGINPYAQGASKNKEFIYGVLIALLTSSLASIIIDLVRSITNKYNKKINSDHK